MIQYIVKSYNQNIPVHLRCEYRYFYAAQSEAGILLGNTGFTSILSQFSIKLMNTQHRLWNIK